MSSVGKIVRVIRNLASYADSYVYGEEGVIMEDNGSCVSVQLKNYKKFPVPYIFDKKELKVLK